MIIELHPHFRKAYQRRIAKNPHLVRLVERKLSIFQDDPTNPQLRDHTLKGKLSNVRAFWVTREIRVVYTFLNSSSVLLLDIGTHDQVY